MYLLIDAGNTRVKWAFTDSSLPALQAFAEARHQGALLHAELEQLPQQWQAACAAGQLAAVWISNVAGAAMQQRLQGFVTAVFAAVPCHWFASSAACAGLRNGYRQPQQLGCDRWAAAIAVHHLYPGQNLIVATGGTATTIDAVLADGQFVGGMILPGLKLMAQSLARNTAQLPQVIESLTLAQPFADHTEAAIVSGCIHAQTGAILQARSSLAERCGGCVSCIISGGAAPYLLPFLAGTAEHRPNLVLTGLAVVAQSCATDIYS